MAELSIIDWNGDELAVQESAAPLPDDKGEGSEDVLEFRVGGPDASYVDLNREKARELHAFLAAWLD